MSHTTPSSLAMAIYLHVCKSRRYTLYIYIDQYIGTSLSLSKVRFARQPHSTGETTQNNVANDLPSLFNCVVFKTVQHFIHIRFRTHTQTYTHFFFVKIKIKRIRLLRLLRLLGFQLSTNSDSTLHASADEYYSFAKRMHSARKSFPAVATKLFVASTL